MSDFEELENIWRRQEKVSPGVSASEFVERAETQMKRLNRQHRGTMGTLAFTISILAVYFLWVSAYKHTLLFVCLSLMTALLLVRIIVEWRSTARLKNISPALSFSAYCKEVSSFYEWRRKVHYILTPIVYLGYFLAFSMLLPLFKENLSDGFYLYILVSGSVVFFALGYFIYRQIKGELNVLKELNAVASKSM